MPPHTEKPVNTKRKRARKLVAPATRLVDHEVRVPTPEEISVRAYYLWEAGAFYDGDPQSYWLRAERELCEQYELARGVPKEPMPAVEHGVA